METTKAKRALSKKESQKERNRIRVAIKRANMNETEREKQKEEQRNTAMFRRLIELPEERERRRERERVRAIERRSSEGSLKREERLRVGRERAVKRRWAESVTEREERLRVNRERVALKRRLKRLGLEGCGLEGYQWQRDSDKCDWSNGIELAGISVEAIVNVLESFPQEQRLGILNLIQSDFSNKTGRNPKADQSAKVPDIMNKLAPKVSSSTTSSQKLQQMLAAGTIHAQEQQVTSLRELLRQEEKRLEMLKQIRSSPAPIKATPTPSMGTVHMTGIDSTHGVIRSTHGLLPSASNTAISSRLQQLVDSVAVTQMSSQATQLKNSLKQQQQAAGKSNNSRANTTSVPQNGIQKTITELDEATIARTIESSTRYREFLIRQSNLKRNFQKQIDKRIGSAPYPKTFRQVWPIIPVQDPHFVKNIGLECVTLYFDPSYRRPPAPPSKIKPTCNQCGCDYASAWQIRKNNSKQVLLCEACDFTNLKLFQRTKLATQLKELMDSVHKEEDRFKQEYEENRKKTVAVERAALLSNIQQQQSVGSKYLSSVPEPATTKRSGPVITNGSPHILVPASQVTPTSTISKKTSVAGGNEDSKRKRRTIEEHGVSKIAKITTGNLDLTLDKISQQLIRKQVDEKVVGRRQKASGINTCVISSVTKGPPPLKQATPISNATPTQSLKYPVVTLPPPLINNSPANSDSRKNRRKGKPRHKLMSNE